MTGVSAGDCTVTVTLRKPGYNDEEHSYAAISVSAGTISVVGNNDAAKWGGSYSAVVVGAATSAPTINTVTPSGAGKSYTTNDSTKCTVDSNGAVTGVATGTNNCQVTVTLRAIGYTDISYTYPNISVGAGTQRDVTAAEVNNTNWPNPYGSGASLTADGSDSLSAPTGGNSGLTGRGGATLEYQKKSSSGNACTVAQDGTITAGTASGTCTVQVHFRSSANYGDSPTLSDLVSITVSSAPIQGASWSGYSEQYNSVR